MKLAITRFIEEGDFSEEAIESFFAKYNFPIVEDTQVTFVFRGEVDRVEIIFWIYGLERNIPLRRIEGTDIWYFTQEIPFNSRIEYKFIIEKNGHAVWIRDPLNPHIARDPFGANSVCKVGYKTPDWVFPDPEVREGKLLQFDIYSSNFSESREFVVYLPARFRKNTKYPFVIFHDGFDYLNYSSMKIVLDNLIHRLEVAPLIAVFTHSPRRLVEYAASETHAKFIKEELVPWIMNRFPTRRDPDSRCLIGASFGAVASLFTSWRYPGFFGKLLLQSGSFAFTDIGKSDRGEVFEPVVNFVNKFRSCLGKHAEMVYMSCGVYESLIYENRSLYPLLEKAGMKVKYEEVRDGHNWENWRDRMRNALSWLFPGPLWFVYE